VKDTLIAHDGAVDAVIRHAIALATADQPGPVHVDLPVGVATRPQRRAPVPALPRRAPAAPAEGGVIEAARVALARAERPLVVAGLDALRHGAGETLTGYCGRLGLPVITTYKAKGLVPESAPFCLGGAGLSPLADRHLLPLVKAADLVLLAGYDPIEMRKGWFEPFAPDATVIEIGPAPIRHGMHAAHLHLRCDVALGLEALLAGLNPRPLWADGAPAAARAALARDFAPPDAWGPHRVFETLRRRLPQETVVTVDSGAHRILMSQMWRCERPGRLLQSSGFCTMGAALPLAIGWAVARPGERSVAVMGDAGLEMVMGELATLRDLALPVTLVVLVDGSLALIALKQRGTGLPSLGVTLGTTDLAALAAALGGSGHLVRSVAELEAALDAAAATPGFSIIGCAIDAQAYEGRI
jgi:acetolactate synthase-1/2/3 large subunit